MNAFNALAAHSAAANAALPVHYDVSALDERGAIGTTTPHNTLSGAAWAYCALRKSGVGAVVFEVRPETAHQAGMSEDVTERCEVQLWDDYSNLDEKPPFWLPNPARIDVGELEYLARLHDVMPHVNGIGEHNDRDGIDYHAAKIEGYRIL